MDCPICGIKVAIIYHEWKGDRAYFEYIHIEEKEGITRTPCFINLSHTDGMARYEQEWKAMMENGDASKDSQTV